MKILLLIPLLLSGCLAPSFQRLVPDNKNFVAEGVEVIVATPWGTQTLKVQKLTTEVVETLAVPSGVTE